MVEERYAGFVTCCNGTGDSNEIGFEIELLDSAQSFDEDGEDLELDDNLEVTCERGVWRMCRGDFSAEWDPLSGQGRIRQAMNPYSLDSVLRIVHSLVLARRGEFLVHSPSAIRNGRALFFAAFSASRNTTM